MRRREALILSTCLALLGASRALGAGPEEKAPPPAKNAVAVAPPLLVSLGEGATPLGTPREQAYLLPPQPLLPPPLPPALPPTDRWFEPPMMSQVVPQFASVPAAQRVTVTLPTTRAPGAGLVLAADLAANVRSPAAAGSAFGIADNESPRPLDRAFVTFDYFRAPQLDAIGAGSPPGLANFGAPGTGSTLGPNSQRAVLLLQQLPSAFPTQYSRYVQAALTQGNFVLSQQDRTNGARLLANASGNNFLTTANRTLLNANSSDARFQALVAGAIFQSGVTSAPVSTLQIRDRPFNHSDIGQLRTGPVNFYRETFGFEKTFLDGNASLGLRMPVFQFSTDAALGTQGVGDVTAVFKYAFYNNRETGDLLSAGLAVTAPTGPDLTTAPGGGAINPTLFQPFVGGIYHVERFYTQAFSSFVVPTDDRSATLWLADLALGYRAYSNPGSDFLTGILPSVEAHFTAPLTQRGLTNSPVGVPDTVVLSAGLNFTFNRLYFTVGASTPITGPQPIEFSGFAQVNFIF